MQKAKDVVKNRKASRAHYWDKGEKVPDDLEDSISKDVTEWEAAHEVFNRAEATVQRFSYCTNSKELLMPLADAKDSSLRLKGITLTTPPASQLAGC